MKKTRYYESKVYFTRDAAVYTTHFSSKDIRKGLGIYPSSYDEQKKRYNPWHWRNVLTLFASLDAENKGINSESIKCIQVTMKY